MLSLFAEIPLTLISVFWKELALVFVSINILV